MTEHKKNFRILKVGDWFVRNDGMIDCIEYGVADHTYSLMGKMGSYTLDGKHRINGSDKGNVAYLINPPDLTPLPMPKVKKWQWLYRSSRLYVLTGSYYASKEECAVNIGVMPIEPYLPSEITEYEI